MKRITEQSLSNAALFYLRRHSAGRKGLERVLERKVLRLLGAKSEDLAAARALIAQVVARMAQSGYVDDSRVAESKTASMHRQGKSSRVIELTLRGKGIAPELAKQMASSTPERELEAANRLVQRKRLGRDPERKQKDLAVLLRAGFPVDLARRALQDSAANRETPEERDPFDEAMDADVDDGELPVGLAPVLRLKQRAAASTPSPELAPGKLLRLPMKPR